jgi:hypothetical protein
MARDFPTNAAIPRLIRELGVFRVIGMVQMRPGAGFIGWALKAGLHAGGGEPVNSVFLGIAQFCTASTGKGLMATAVAAGGGNVLQACRHVADETYRRNEDQSAHGEGVKIEG